MFLYKNYIDYKYQLSQVITKYISKQFEYQADVIQGAFGMFLAWSIISVTN